MKNKITKRRLTTRTGKSLSGLCQFSFDRLEPRRLLAADLPLITSNMIPFIVDSSTFNSFMSCVSGNQTACQLLHPNSQPSSNPDPPETTYQIICQIGPDSSSQDAGLDNVHSTSNWLDTISISSLSIDLLNNHVGTHSSGCTGQPTGSGSSETMNPRSSDGIADYFESAGSTDNVVPTVNTTQQQQASFEPGLVSAPAANSRSVSPSPAGVLQPISMMASRDTDFVAYGAPLQIDINRQEYFTTLQDGSISNANKLTEKSLGQSGLIDRFQAFLIDDASTGVSVYADASNVEHPYVSRYNDTEGLIAKHQSAFENENTESAIEEVRMTRTGDGLPAFQPGDELAELVGSRSDNSQSSVSDESISPFQIAVFRHADETGPLQLVSELQKRQDISRDDFVFRDDEESVQKSGYFAIIPPAESTLIFAGILATTWYREEKSEKPNDGGNATGPNSGPPG